MRGVITLSKEEHSSGFLIQKQFLQDCVRQRVPYVSVRKILKKLPAKLRAVSQLLIATSTYSACFLSILHSHNNFPETEIWGFPNSWDEQGIGFQDVNPVMIRTNPEARSLSLGSCEILDGTVPVLSQLVSFAQVTGPGIWRRMMKASKSPTIKGGKRNLPFRMTSFEARKGIERFKGCSRTVFCQGAPLQRFLS
ncbi:hypothetical protein CROQUDRAFT_90644 [Cronartium quercuum f. sp. fusiforme G11]|uniref:Uncharacterized protein n=1 Tax=Cronartium quercuum f. sp. fusiforme G11 TaxID=708437 RepID=A0A9P6NM63_9BASI|nr:hypothetical protein CROQUDRAFT_90644 [Cronartium quercuum f. sp. fusiforme G11]